MTFCDDIADTSCWETSENIDYFTASIQAQYTNPQKKKVSLLIEDMATKMVDRKHKLRTKTPNKDGMSHWLVW